jgi:hypothetical protein
VRIGDLIKQIKIHRPIVSAAVVAVVALGAYGVASATASSPSPPINDNYIDSLEFNTPGKPLNDTETLKSVVDTTNATTQSNIFNPCGQSNCPAGPSELTTCQGVSYGKTVWYDFYPNANGVVRIRTSGFANVIALYTFNTNPRSQFYLLPDGRHRQCVPSSGFPSNELDANVKKGVAYTFQIGGEGTNGGLLQTLFDFFKTSPHRLSADSTLKARALSNGIELLGLSVTAPAKARVEVNCGSQCNPKAKTGSSTESFPSVNGVQLPAGSKLQIRVSSKNAIGVFIQYTVLPGNFTKIVRCMEPGSRTPRLKCH